VCAEHPPAPLLAAAAAAAHSMSPSLQTRRTSVLVRGTHLRNTRLSQSHRLQTRRVCENSCISREDVVVVVVVVPVAEAPPRRPRADSSARASPPHLWSLEGLACSTPMVAAQASAEGRGCHTWKVGDVSLSCSIYCNTTYCPTDAHDNDDEHMNIFLGYLAVVREWLDSSRLCNVSHTRPPHH